MYTFPCISNQPNNPEQFICETKELLFLLFCHTQEWYGLLSSSFAAILLLSSSTLIAIELSIQSELEIQTSAIYSSSVKLSRGGSGSKSNNKKAAPLKKASIKTTATMTTAATTPSSESSVTSGTEASSTDHIQSPTESIRKQQVQPRTAMKFSNLSSSNRGVKSAIGLSWLLPTLCAMCIPMIHKIMNHHSNEWWLEVRSPDFIIFAITESLLGFLFAMLFVTLMKHLVYLAKKYEKANATLKKR